MKQVFLVLALLGLVAGANAVPNDLSNGVFITHAPADFVYSPGMDWCAEYANQYGIASCEEQITNMPIMGLESTLFYVVAAWNEDKVWCGTEFGISADFAEDFYFTEFGPCLENNLEISTSGWPGAGEGTAVVATDIQWEGNFVPVYFFTGYTYNTTRIQLDVDPAQDFAGTGNCDVPALLWDAVCLGAVGTGDDMGEPCCPPMGPDPEACCFEDGTCELMLEYECGVAGGVYYGGECDPNPCPQPVLPGACCIETGECFVLLEEDCNTIGGEFLGEETVCDPNPCPQPPVAVCCVGEDCYIINEYECADMQGEFHPEWDTCDPNPCLPTPADDNSWGSIKALYR
jgi:hypothetical protein